MFSLSFVSSRSIHPDSCVLPFSNSQLASQIVTVLTSLLAFYLPVTLMVILYFRVYLITKQHCRLIGELQGAAQTVLPIAAKKDWNASLKPTPDRRTNTTRTIGAANKLNDRKAEGRAAKTLSAILLAFIVTWSPYHLFAIITVFDSSVIPDVLYHIGKFVTLTSWFDYYGTIYIIHH